METHKATRNYTLKEYFKIINKATYSIIKFNKNIKMISKEFNTNIMLAVTEVNGCAMCNYYHTKQAIDSGIEESELKSLLSGDLAHAKDEELVALLFAQHYASEKENYSQETFQKVIDYYGLDKAMGILSIIRLISFGNVSGIASGNFFRRFTKKGRIKNSNIFKELFIMISLVILMPCGLIFNIFTKKKYQ